MKFLQPFRNQEAQFPSKEHRVQCWKQSLPAFPNRCPPWRGQRKLPGGWTCCLNVENLLSSNWIMKNPNFEGKLLKRPPRKRPLLTEDGMEKWTKPNGSIDIQWCSHINQVQEEPDLFQIGTGLVDAFDSVCMIHLLHWMLTESEVSCKLNRSFTPTPAALLLFGVSHHLKRDLTQGPQQGSSGWSLGSSGSKGLTFWHLF